MEAPKTLRRPSNWQDFETLCKKLWGEIWSCPEIKKNGRSGQEQHGVDIYGIPFGETEYYGIQCKGKDEYTHKQFTEAEITKEIKLAKDFKPKLKKLYFTTTAVKDASIEEFVRKLNIAHLKKGLFEVHIFSWEDIVDKIDENKYTHDWYVKSQNFKMNKAVQVTFQDFSSEIIADPKFKKTYTNHIQKIIPAIGSYNTFRDLAKGAAYAKIEFTPLSESKINLSYWPFCLNIKNVGTDSIEEFKLLFTIEGEIQDLSDTNEIKTGLLAAFQISPSTIDVTRDPFGGIIEPKKKILVGDDVYTTADFFLKPFHKETSLTLKWKLISKDFKDSGELKINIKPNIETKYEDILVEDPRKVGAKESEIVDFIIIEKDK